MEEKKSNRIRAWAKRNSDALVWTGSIGIGIAVFVVTSKMLSKNVSKEFQDMLIGALDKGNAVLFDPSGQISVIPPKKAS